MRHRKFSFNFCQFSIFFSLTFISMTLFKIPFFRSFVWIYPFFFEFRQKFSHFLAFIFDWYQTQIEIQMISIRLVQIGRNETSSECLAVTGMCKNSYSVIKWIIRVHRKMHFVKCLLAVFIVWFRFRFWAFCLFRWENICTKNTRFFRFFRCLSSIYRYSKNDNAFSVSESFSNKEDKKKRF